MTNAEKHIEKLLSWYKEAVTENGVCYLTCDDKNTLAYAIKCCKHFEDIKKDIDSWMLREEPSSSGKPNKSEIPTSSDDCISRQDVLSEIIRFSTEEGSSVECQQLYCDVNNMPSVTPQEPRWIPVSERLPQEAFGCLVTVIDTDVHTQEEFENILPYFVGYDGETWNDADGEPISFEVIAWMPLPEPYREVEE
jgi:hypothetical protein